MFRQLIRQLLFIITIAFMPNSVIAVNSLNPDYDADRPVTSGADEYGMKRYVMAFLKRGPNSDRTKEEAKVLQSAHMANIGRLADAGKLVLAGPFLEEGELRGIYIFNVVSIEEAKALTASDPAIQAGSLIMELKTWYGSAALTEMNELHKIMSKTSM